MLKQVNISKIFKNIGPVAFVILIVWAVWNRGQQAKEIEFSYLPESLGYERIEKAEALKKNIYCLYRDSSEPIGKDLKRCSFESEIHEIVVGDVIQIDKGAITINYILADKEGMNSFSTQGVWSCIGIEDLEFLAESLDQKPLYKKPWINIPNCQMY